MRDGGEEEQDWLVGNVGGESQSSTHCQANDKARGRDLVAQSWPSQERVWWKHMASEKAVTVPGAEGPVVALFRSDLNATHHWFLIRV